MTAVSFASILLAAEVPASGSGGFVIGVDVDNPQRLGAEQQDAVLDQLQRAQVNVIRAPLKPPWDGDDYRPAIDFIRRAYERGIKTELIVQLQYRKDARKRPAIKGQPDLWPSYPLSSADPTRFRMQFEPLLNRLEDAGVVLVAFELGNEINSPSFNGDFSVVERQGRVFSAEDLRDDRDAGKIAEGYRQYIQVLWVLKEIRDRSRLNRDIPILSAGLADPGPAGPRGTKTDAAAIAGSLQYLREKGIDGLVDAYGVHAYPWAKTAAKRLLQLEQDTLSECRSRGHGKPCWLTEWGLPAESGACPLNDASRAATTRELLADFSRFARQGRLQGLIYYAWTDDTYGIYRCAMLTESGRLALDPKSFTRP
jgi:hypothetical protein